MAKEKQDNNRRPDSGAGAQNQAHPAGNGGPERPSSAFSGPPEEGRDVLVLPPEKEPLTPVAQREREHRRRRYELIFAGAAFLVVLVLTMVQLNKQRVEGWLFVIVYHVNFVLLAAVLLVVLRNAFKLLLERRRRVMGSRIRTRLVLTFVFFSLLPCLLMFLVTTKYMQLSIDFWLNDEVETSMKTAFNVANVFYEKAGDRMVTESRVLEKEMLGRRMDWGGDEMGSFLSAKRAEYGFALSGLVDANGQERNWFAVNTADAAWREAKGGVNWEKVNVQGYDYFLATGGDEDFLISIIAFDSPGFGYLVTAEEMGKGFKGDWNQADKSFITYGKLRQTKTLYKRVLFSSLGVLSAFIVLGAIWFGFRVAREVSAPVIGLARAFQRIARGDLSVRVDDPGSDEMATLARSFNNMARDLEQSRRGLTTAYTKLEEQNQDIARHNVYIQTVLNNIAAGVVSLDQDDRISTVNSAACEILRKTPEEMVGKRVEEVFPGQFVGAAGGLLKKFRQRPDSRSQHSVSVNIGGTERRLLINVVSFSTDSVYSGAVAVFEDISELERMQRMAAWREVAKRIAHEIKNPLTPIKLSAQRLERKFGGRFEDPAFSQSTQLIVRQVEHLQGMVAEFSAFAKMPEVKPEPGELAPILEPINALFQVSHSRIAWTLNIPPGLPRLAMDKEALHRAFMNIYTNAAEALEAFAQEEPDKAPEKPFVETTVSYDEDLDLVRIDVADNGPGLTEEERSRLFEPYFSHKKGGTGLGLTIVRSIVSDHRGYVRAIPRHGGGTVISMELPVV